MLIQPFFRVSIGFGFILSIISISSGFSVVFIEMGLLMVEYWALDLEQFKL